MQEAINRFSSYEKIADYIIDDISSLLDTAQTPLSIALSGGSTPEKLYKRMGRELGNKLKEHSLILQVDERLVPPDNDDCNMKMIRDSLIVPAAIPEQRLLSINTHLSHTDAALDYSRKIEESALIKKNSDGRPVIDLVLLGLGSDGHTASLFSPDDCRLQGTAVATVPAQLPHKRISLSYDVLIHAKRVLFVVTGAGKASRVEEIAAGGAPFPGAQVLYNNSTARLLIDDAAGSLL